MPHYFHVLISERDAPDKLRCIFYDMSEPDLHRQVVAPYRRGKSIVSRGKIFPSAELRGIKITRTTAKANDSLSAASRALNDAIESKNRDPRSGVVFMPFAGFGLNDLGRTGDDVTSVYIKGPPGEGGASQAINVVLSHPWVSGVGTAVVAAAIAAWLKLV